jgi:hypothetical protein
MNSETRDSENTPHPDIEIPPTHTNSLPKGEGADPSVEVPEWPEMLVRSESDEFVSEDPIDEQEENK